MPDGSANTTGLRACLGRVRDGDASALNELILLAGNRLQALTHRMLRDYPRVRWWAETDDVLQNALVRLCRALEQVHPASARDFYALATTQIRRELIDLARHYSGPENAAANHESRGDAPAEPGAADLTHEPGARVGRFVKLAQRRPVWAAAMLLIVVASGVAAGRGYVGREQARGRVEAEQERKRTRAVEVAPQAREILQRHCYECHGADPATAGRKFLVLDRASLLDPDRRNVVPGRPEDSRLLHRIEDNTMPPEDDDHWLPRVSEHELSVVKEWIAGGAPEFPPDHVPPAVPPSELAADVHAVFVRHCVQCHQVAEAGGGIKVLNHNLLLARKVVIPGKPDESEVYTLLLKGPNEKLVMPPIT